MLTTHKIYAQTGKKILALVNKFEVLNLDARCGAMVDGWTSWVFLVTCQLCLAILVFGPHSETPHKTVYIIMNHAHLISIRAEPVTSSDKGYKCTFSCQRSPRTNTHAHIIYIYIYIHNHMQLQPVRLQRCQVCSQSPRRPLFCRQSWHPEEKTKWSFPAPRLSLSLLYIYKDSRTSLFFAQLRKTWFVNQNKN